VLPVPDAIGELAKAHKLVVTVEDNGVAGGVGSAVSAALRRAVTRFPGRAAAPSVFSEHQPARLHAARAKGKSAAGGLRLVAN